MNTNTSKKKEVVSWLIAMPFALSAIWVLGLLAVCIPVILPYVFLVEHSEFGFFRVVIVGTCINLAVLCTIYTCWKTSDWLGQKYTDKLVGYALIEMVTIAVLSIGVSNGFSW